MELLVILLFCLAVLADIEKKHRQLEEKIVHEFDFKDTYRENYIDRFMRVD